MSDEQGESEPSMHIDSIGFLRLLPPNREAHPAYDEGVALFCSSEDTAGYNYGKG